MSNLRDKVQALANVFAEEIINAISEEMSAAFEVGASATPSVKQKTHRAAPKRAKGAKRDPNALAELTHDLEAVIKSKPGQRIEEIGKIMGAATKELALPVKKLLAAKRIRVTGQRRATKYFPAGASSKAPPKKASSKKAPKKKK